MLRKCGYDQHEHDKNDGTLLIAREIEETVHVGA